MGGTVNKERKVKGVEEERGDNWWKEGNRDRWYYFL